MTKILPIILFLLPTLSFGQTFITMDTLTDYPAKINSKVKGEIDKVFQIDFTGDSQPDYIVQTKLDKKGKVREVWLTSNFLIFNKKLKNYFDLDFMRFINLDDDPEPEERNRHRSSKK